MLHGWGFHSGIWNPVSDALHARGDLWQVDLPGHGRSALCSAYTLDDLSALLAPRLPIGAVWLGWSLGGLIALRQALSAPDSIRGLILVASTPRFIQAQDWPHAMRTEVLTGFAQRLERDWAGTLQRFLALQVKDSPHARDDLRALKQELQKAPPQAAALAGGLQLLAESDLRARLGELRCPVCVVLGSHDALVPAAVAEDWRRLLPVARVFTIAGASHIPFFSHPQAFLAALDDFFDGQ